MKDREVKEPKGKGKIPKKDLKKAVKKVTEDRQEKPTKAKKAK